MGKYREVIFVEEVVDGKFERKVNWSERETFLERYVAHKVFGEMAREGVLITRHGESSRIVYPFVEESP